MASMEEKIYSIIQVADKLPSDLDFAKVIKLLTNNDVIPFDADNNKSDKRLLDKLTHICTQFIQENQTDEGIGIQTDADLRIMIPDWVYNSISSFLRDVSFIREVKKSRTVYPRISFKDEVGMSYYLTLRTTKDDDPESRYSAFYFSPKVKVKESGKHLMITFTHTILPETEDTNRALFLEGFRINDLSDLKINLKLGFNATYKQIAKTNLIIKESF